MTVHKTVIQLLTGPAPGDGDGNIAGTAVGVVFALLLVIVITVVIIVVVIVVLRSKQGKATFSTGTGFFGTNREGIGELVSRLTIPTTLAVSMSSHYYRESYL